MTDDVSMRVQHPDAQFHHMQSLDNTIRVNYKISNGINQFLSYRGGFLKKGFTSLYWDIEDVLASLKAKFRTAFRHQSCHLKVPDIDKEEFCSFIQSIISRSNGFEYLEYLDNVFKVILMKDLK